MNVSTLVKRSLGAAALAAVVVGFAAPAQASPVPPSPNRALYGTWVNVDPSTRSVKQVVVAPNNVGSVSVDAFGACTPSLCEWGSVPGIVYGPSVSSTTGASFQTNQRFLSGDKEWSRTTLLGRLIRTSAGLRLTLRELTVFEDGSGRRNYTVTEQFQLGEGQKPTKAGNAVNGYVMGAPPALVKGAFGSWKNISATGALAGVKITGTPANPVVEGFGRCTPNPCDFGFSKGITYGPSISATTGRTVLAPYTFGFKNEQLVITYRRTTAGERLTIANYNEFTDGSGRSNYTMVETFVRS